jgi:hypothetical protein
MATNTTSQFEINGIIDTSQNVLENINTLATASGCFVTWDEHAGTWNVIINTTGTSVFSFDDTNIIGSINVNGTGVTELYNSASITFPNADARDTVDTVDVEIPSADRYSNELDNRLDIKLDCISNPIQAGYIASRELKQSRVDKVISFTTNFLGNGVKAGDIIDVTATTYGYTSKLFRVISVEEEDDDEGNILFGITALEYDADVYDSTGLIRNSRSKKTGVVQKINNQAVQTSEDIDFGKQIGRLLIGNAAAALLRNFLSVDEETGVLTNDIAFQDENLQGLMESFTAPPTSVSASAEYVCEGSSVTVTSSTSCNVCYFDNPSFTYDYSITGVTVGTETSASEINAQIAGVDVGSTGTIALGDTITLTAIDGNITSQKTITVTIGSGSDTITLYPTPDSTYQVTANPTSITEGDSTDITITTTGVTDGTTIPYAITGSATGKVTSPSLTGNVTINSNTATVTIDTNDDSTYTGTQSLTFTIAPSGVTPTPCGTFDYEATISVADNDTAPPEPTPDNTCEYVQVPLVWCGVYDGDDDELKSVTVRKYVYLPVAQAGEATVNVPTALSVTKGSPSTITVSSTTAVASSSSLGGTPYQVITAFNSVPTLGLITGSSTTTVYGYDL